MFPFEDEKDRIREVVVAEWDIATFQLEVSILSVKDISLRNAVCGGDVQERLLISRERQRVMTADEVVILGFFHNSDDVVVGERVSS